MRLYTIAVGIFIVVNLIAHARAPDAYFWAEHTMSHLGAQAYEHAYIMRIGLGSFGALLLLASAWKVAKAPRPAWPYALIGIYGLAILLTGFFSTSPFVLGVPFSATEANMHSALATLAGIAISAAMLSFALTEPSQARRVIHIVALVLTTLISAAFFSLGSAEGVFQRLLWIVGFSWLALLEVPAVGLLRPTQPSPSG